MSCTLGKVGLGTASGGDGLSLQSPDRIKLDGDTLKVGGDFAVTDAVGRALAAQLSGYGPHNPDEPIIPFTYSAAQHGGDLNGYYAALGVTVDYRKLAAGLFSWDADLLAIPGRQAPLFQLVSKGAARGGGSVASGDPWVGIPFDGNPSYSVGDFTGIAATPETTAAGTVGLIATGSGLDYFYDGWLTFYCDVADAYLGCCGIEVTYDGGTTWYSVVGRQIPNDLDGWRLTNHRVRISVFNNAAGTLRIEYFDGSQWESNDFLISNAVASGGGPGSTVTNYDAVTILRNGSEAAAVQLAAGYSTVTLGVRRGGTLIEGQVYEPRGTFNLGIWRTASEAATSITGGIEATTAVAGNKYVLLSPDTITKDVTGQSGIEITAAGTDFHFAAGVNNSSILAGNISIQEQYFAANRVRQRIGVR